MDFVIKQIQMAQDRAQLEDKRPFAAAVKLSLERGSETRLQMQAERRKLMLSVANHDGFLAARRTVAEVLNSGGVYHAILGELYGPPGSADEPEKPPPIDDDIPW
ncbi:hypothetical protein IB276_11745 [Ensifer sp. ENS04]|uniref:hypothetical protein n=1 Tax=Ensifer sp. ENS04 TaxID=2769281 RepID=UPI0017868CD9|nr:hypothetical protein [Ensifer sp. ENS04]MBD9540126.1 hypothetical protein [Ensifer sp. ENS04]